MHRSLLPCQLFAFAAASLAAGCATPWQKIQTKHVTLYTDSDFGHEEVLRSLENGHAMLASSFLSNTHLPERIDVLFMDDVPFQGLMGAYRKGVALAKAPGSTGIGTDGLLILRPMAAGRSSEVDVNAASAFTSSGQGGIRQQNRITSESGGIAGSGVSVRDARAVEGNLAGRAAVEMLAHLYLQRAMPNAPLWFHEGFAAYVRDGRFNQAGNQAVACFGYPPTLSGTDVLMEPEKVWNATWDQYGGEYRSWLPYSGQILLDYIIQGEGGANRDKLGVFVTGLGEGKAAPEALNASFGWNSDGLSAKLKEHVQAVQQQQGKSQSRGGCPLMFPVAGSDAPDTAEPQKSDAAEESINALIAAIETLPDRDGYQPYYPQELIERAGKPGKKR